MQNFTDTQNLLQATGRLDEMVNFTVYYTNEHAIKRELNGMVWAKNQSDIPSLAVNSFRSTSFSVCLIVFTFIATMLRQV